MKINENVKLGLLFLFAVAIRIAFLPSFDFAFDDAYINYRIARNLARGWGLVFNSGQHVLVTTTPLYTFLIVPGVWLGFGGVLWSKLLNSLAMAFSAVLIYKILRGKVRIGLIWFTVLWLTISYFDIAMNLMGMESTVVYLCLLLATYLYQQNKGWLLGLVLSLTSLARPECILAVLLFWLAVLFFERKMIWQVSLPTIVIGGGWLIYSLLFYGSIIPNTYTAKEAFFQGTPLPLYYHWVFVSTCFLNAIPLAPLSVLFLPLGIWRIFTSSREFLPLCLWALVVLLVQFFSNFFLPYWYVAMLLPLYLVIIILGIEQFFSRILPAWSGFFKKRVVIAVVFVALLVNNYILSSVIYARLLDFKMLDHLSEELGTWFKEEKIPKEKVIAIEAIGQVGYTSDLRILDTFGLASPEMIPYLRAKDMSDETILNQFHPDYYICTNPSLGAEFSNYRIAKTSTIGKMSKTGVPRYTYIYEKIE